MSRQSDGAPSVAALSGDALVLWVPRHALHKVLMVSHVLHHNTGLHVLQRQRARAFSEHARV